MRRVLTLFVVVILGIIIGVSVLSKKVTNPALNMMVKQQNDILEAQKRIESKLFPEEKTVFLNSNGEAVSSDSPAVNNVQIKALESRVAFLEDQITFLKNSLKELAKQPGQRQGPPPEDFDTKHEISLGESPIQGPKDAKVTIIEYVDAQCPYCSRFHQTVLDVLSAYPNDVNLVIKHFPLSFHAMAKPAAKAALAANEQGKFFEMMNKLLADNQELSPEKFETIAKEIGIDVKKFKKDLTAKDADWETIINKDIEQGSAATVRGTPTFFINGRKTRARDLATFKTEIDAILNEKKQ
jgi:protein-disulfide isomerase